MTSIIIPTRRKKNIEECLESIKKYTKDYELVLIKQKAGFVHKINQGIKRAKGDYLVFLHDDCVVTKGWLDEVAEVGTFRVGEKNDEGEIWGGFINPARYNYNINDNPDYSFFLCISKDAMSKIGLFDETFTEPMYQDVDMGLHIANAGYKIKCLNGKIIHKCGEGSGQDNEKQKQYLNEKWGLSY